MSDLTFKINIPTSKKHLPGVHKFPKHFKKYNQLIYTVIIHNHCTYFEKPKQDIGQKTTFFIAPYDMLLSRNRFFTRMNFIPLSPKNDPPLAGTDHYILYLDKRVCNLGILLKSKRSVKKQEKKHIHMLHFSLHGCNNPSQTVLIAVLKRIYEHLHQVFKGLQKSLCHKVYNRYIFIYFNSIMKA